ncbi:MAG TPA: CehA/McbA family metallohydrolase [Ignavibacteriaceae bacterium]|nr:CehA/McbA family metallohydrolase [Ignavibacteriaceae bacterium]
MKKILVYCSLFVIILFHSLVAQSINDSTFSKVNIPRDSKQTIYGRITDSNGKPIIAQVQVWYFPLTEVVFAFGSEPTKGRTDNLIGITYSSNNGYYAIKVPADTMTLIITKGPEWDLFKEKIIVNNNEFDGIEKNISLKHLYDLKKLGWYGGDTHHHSLHSDGRQTPSQIASAMKGVGLSWGFLSDHNSTAGNIEWRDNSSFDFIAIPANEISTEPAHISDANGFGHMNQSFINNLNGSYPLLKNIWSRAVFKSHYDVQKMIEETKKQNGFISINHPFQSWDWSGRFKSWGFINNFDAIEVWNGDPPHSLTTSSWDKNKININTWAVHAWFSYLNAGNRLSGIAGSDCHDIFGTHSYPKGEYYWTTTTGNARTYVHTKKLNSDAIKKSLKEGRIFLTSGFGPILLVEADKKYPGEILKVPSNGIVNVEIKVLANQQLLMSNDAVRIIVNGLVVQNLSTDSSLTYNKSHSIVIEKDSWIVVQAFGQWPMYAITNPIYLDYPPYGDYPKKEFVNPLGTQAWNNFLNHPEITVPDGPTSWKNSYDVFNKK